MYASDAAPRVSYGRTGIAAQTLVSAIGRSVLAFVVRVCALHCVCVLHCARACSNVEIETQDRPKTAEDSSIVGSSTVLKKDTIGLSLFLLEAPQPFVSVGTKLHRACTASLS